MYVGTINGVVSTEYIWDEHATPQYVWNYVRGITVSHQEKGNGFDNGTPSISSYHNMGNKM